MCGENEGLKSHGNAGESSRGEGLTCGAGSAGTCRPGRANTGLGVPGSDSREAAQLPEPVPPWPALLPAALRGCVRSVRTALFSPAPLHRQPARRGERERSAKNWHLWEESGGDGKYDPLHRVIRVAKAEKRGAHIHIPPGLVLFAAQHNLPPVNMAQDVFYINFCTSFFRLQST